MFTYVNVVGDPTACGLITCSYYRYKDPCDCTIVVNGGKTATNVYLHANTTAQLSVDTSGIVVLGSCLCCITKNTPTNGMINVATIEMYVRDSTICYLGSGFTIDNSNIVDYSREVSATSSI